MLNNSEVKKLVEIAHQGGPKSEEAYQKLILENSSYITSIITNSFSTFCANYYDDLLQSGRIGLYTALTRYDASKGAITTFSRPYICHEITDYINTFIMDTSKYYGLKISKIKRAIRDLENSGLKSPTVADISSSTGISVDSVKNLLAVRNSLEKTYYDGDTSGAVLATVEETPETALLTQERQDTIVEAMKNLSEEEKICLIYKFGLGQDRQFTNAEIHEKTGISPSKIRKYQCSGLSKLKRDKNMSTIFSDYRNTTRKVLDDYEVAIVPVGAVELMLSDLESSFVQDGLRLMEN